MKHQKYTALFLASAASVVVASEIYAAPADDHNYQQENKQFVTSEVISTSTLAPELRETFSAASIEAVPTFTSETELVNYIIDKMEDLNSAFEARYVGDTSDLIRNKKLKQLIEEARDENDYLIGIGSAVSYDVKFTSYEANIKFTASYFITKEQQKFVDAEAARINAQIIRHNMTDLEKVLAINEYIVKNTTYTFNSSTSPHAAYALFKEGKGVCQAYAMAAYHLFKDAGLETHYVTGHAGEDHAWNLVKVNGQWYHIDPTWSDPTFSTSIPGLENFISYQYFLLSDETLLAERTMDARPHLPKATAKNFEVFRLIESTPFILNNVQYMLLPEYGSNQLFYVDYKDNYAINTLNLAKSPLAIERLANVRAMDILATDHAIYFVDMDHQLGLSKIDLQTKAIKKLYKGSTVTSIKLEGGIVKAYNNQSLVYSENIKDEELRLKTEKIIQLVNSIVLPGKQFKMQAEELNSLIAHSTVDVQASLTDDVRKKIAYIQKQYKKLSSLTFKETVNWSKTQAVLPIQEARKPWTVTLSMEVANNAKNLDYIHLVDMFGDPVYDAKISIKNNTITITPNQDYIKGVPYTLIIDGGLQSATGAVLSKGTHLTFKFGE